MSEEKGRPLPKFGDWDVNDPASAEGFTVIFNKARDEKKTGGKPESPSNLNPGFKQAAAPVKKPPAVGGGADHYGDEDMDVVREEWSGYAATFIFK